MSARDIPDDDPWVQRALAARMEQGFPPGVEDDDALDFIAEMFLQAERVETMKLARGARRTQTTDAN